MATVAEQTIPEVRRAFFDRPLDLPSDPVTHRICWTREAAFFLVDSGLIDGSRYELLNGEVVEKVKNRPHINAMVSVQDWIQQNFPRRHFQYESPVIVALNEQKTNDPEPDAAILNRPATVFADSNPMPTDVLLLIEVAHTTLDTDLGYKAGLYARAGYREYWVLDVAHRKLHVHRNPQTTMDGDTRYSVRVYAQDEAISPLAAPDVAVTASALLPPE